MKSLDEIIEILQANQQLLREQHLVRRIGIFGSHARQKQSVVSDLDILVELEGPVGWEIVDLHRRLEEILGIKVDLVTRGAAIRKPLLWQSIQEDLIYV